jgi:mono/diheme cytochrome c family protein
MRFGKALAITAAALGVALAAAAVWVLTAKPALRPASAETIEGTTERLRRGRYLAVHVLSCFDCHTRRDWSRWGGPSAGPLGAGGHCFTRDDGFPGFICAPNITPDEATGIGGWTDGEILRAIREGVDRTGRALYPRMPYLEYRHLAEEDVRSVVAYLRSIPAVRNATPETRISFPASFFVKRLPQPVEGPVAEPDSEDRVAYGRYLAEISGCKSCHTPVDRRQRPVPELAYSGGHEFKGPYGTHRASNLTPHASGMGSRTRDQFIGMFKAFSDPETVAVEVEPGHNTVMPWFALAGMSAEDLGAIFDYLRTVPAIDNRVEERSPQNAGRVGSGVYVSFVR